MNLTINVTQEDIDKGKAYKHDGYKCPLARAFKRSIGIKTFILSNTFQIADALSKRYPAYILPQEGASFITKLYFNKELKPIPFTINIPAEHIKYCED